MKRKIRNGNDVPIVWTLIDEHNLPYTVEGKDVQVEMIVGTTRIPVKDFAMSGNEISFTYYGKDQKAVGNVSLVYYENRGKSGMVTYDTKDDTFEMVSHSWLAVDSDEAEGQVTTESVSLRSQIVAGGGGSTIVVDNYMSPISTNPVQNKVITEALGGKQDTLRSGENVKTINGESIVGEGDITIHVPTELSELEGDTEHQTVSAEEKALASGEWHPLTISPAPPIEEGQFLTKNYHIVDDAIVLDWVVSSTDRSASADAEVE